MESGIYEIQSLIKPERIYIGSAINITKRWYVHLRELNKKSHHSKKLQRHFNKYGESDLIFTVLFRCEKEFLLNYEQYLLDRHNPYFNNCKIAGSVLGIRLTDERKKQISNSMIGNKHGHNSMGKKRKPFTEEHKAKLRGKRKPYNLSDEHRDKLRQRMMGNEVWRKSIGIKRGGWKFSDEVKEKMRIRMMGNKINNGRKHSEERKREIGKKSKLAWAERKRKKL